MILPLSQITVAEGVGFEPTVGLRLLLISSQVPSTTQPPFRLTFNTAKTCENLRLLNTVDNSQFTLKNDSNFRIRKQFQYPLSQFN